MEKVYRKLDVIVCCSAFLKKKLDTNPDLRGKTVALHNFISTKKAPDVEKQDYVLYFGRFSKERASKPLQKPVKLCRISPLWRRAAARWKGNWPVSRT